MATKKTASTASKEQLKTAATGGYVWILDPKFKIDRANMEMLKEIHLEQIDYPYWKKLIWHFLRAGVAGGVTSALTVTFVLNQDLSNLTTLLTTLWAAFTTGFIVAAGKAFRDWQSEGDKTALVNKLPI